MLNVDAIHAATPSPVEVARRLGLETTKVTRRSVRVRCPWHRDENPSCDLSIRDGRLVAYCRSCGEGGDLFSLVAAVEGLDPKRHFRDVVRAAADLVGVQIADDDAKPRERDPISDLAIALDAAAASWFRSGRILARDAEAIEWADPKNLREAHRLLVKADELRRKERDDVDARLELVGDILERSGALDWIEPCPS